MIIQRKRIRFLFLKMSFISYTNYKSWYRFAHCKSDKFIQKRDLISGYKLRQSVKSPRYLTKFTISRKYLIKF